MRGAELSRAYATEVVGPLLDAERPGMLLGLARLGSGSDVLGHDDVASRDHDWGLRITVLVPAEEVDAVDALLQHGLPETWNGRPTRFPVTWDERVHQRAEVTTTLGFARFRTGLDLTRDPDPVEWLSLTGQSVLELTAGEVYRDDDGSIRRLRERLAGYPRDVRVHALSSGWAKIGQELPFVARTAALGDDVGSRAIAARLVVDAMHLGFLLEKRWAPYSKWLGTDFVALPRAGRLTAPLRRAVAAASGSAREAALVEALEGLARLQGELGLPTLSPATEPFFARGSRGLRGIPELLRDAIGDPRIRALPPIGTADQWTDSVELTTHPERRVRIARALYGTPD